MESAIPEEQDQQVPGVEEIFRELYWEAGNVVLQLLRLSGTEDALLGLMCSFVQRGVDTKTG